MRGQLRFVAKDTQFFFATLKKRVDEYFENNHLTPTGNFQMFFKTVAMYLMYMGTFVVMLTVEMPLWALLSLAVLMGIGAAGVGFSVMHDANHSSYSKNEVLNKLIARVSMLLLGGNTFTWKVQHNLLHHTYTNVYEHDEDIHDKPMLRLSPHGILKKHHRYQHLYAIFLYGLMTVSWVTTKDFTQWYDYTKQGLTQKSGFNPTWELVSMIFSKLVYYFLTIVMPIAIFNIIWWQWVLVLAIVHFVGGAIMAVVFQLAHVVEGTQHLKPTPVGTVENTWAIHQLLTTADFARHNPLLSWFVGGLNFQVEHHLFPKICHIHYKAISEIVKQTAAEFGLPYHDQPSFWSAVGSHFRILKQLGRHQTMEQIVVY